MRYALLALVLCTANVAMAGPRQVLVLRAEGTADAASRTTIDTHVLRLAKNLDGKVDAGDITLTEAAALVGCNPSDSACKDDLLTTLGVDEMVATTVTATPTGMNVTVRRIVRGSAPRAAQTTIPAGKSPDAKLDTDIGPLFGIAAAPAPAPADGRLAPVEPADKPAKPAPSPAPAAPPPPAPPPVTTVADATPAPAASDVSAAPNGTLAPPPPEGRNGKRWPKIGMGVGAGLVALGMLMWASASDVQDQIDNAPEPRSPADFKALQDLERKGDDRAGAGNLFFITGAALGGVSAYFYVKAGKSASTQTARIAPAAFPHGAGVTLTIGGVR